MPDTIPWRDYDPFTEFEGGDVSRHLADMRFVQSTRKHVLEPKDVTHRLEPYRKMREGDPTRFITELTRLERELSEKVDAEIAKQEADERRRTGKSKTNEDTAHCLGLVEKLIAEWHVKNPGALEMKP